MFQATPYLTSLGLSATVMREMANSSQMNAGAYGPPSSNPSNPSVWQSVGTAIWNTVSGVIGALSVVWSSIVAAACYMAELAAKVAAWGLKVLTQTLSVLQSVAGAIANALDTLLIIIKQEALAVFSPITSAINDAMSSWTSPGLVSSFNRCVQDYIANGTVKPVDARGFFAALSGGPFMVITGLSVALEIALVILSAFSIGSSFIAASVFSQPEQRRLLPSTRLRLTRTPLGVGPSS